MKRVVVFVLVGACRLHDAFECMTDDQCSGGTCEPTRFCSFPDPECASGQRYHETAGDGLAHTCVTRDAGVEPDAYAPAVSCKALLAVQPATPSGMYMIDPDGMGPDAPLSVFCDMTTTPAGGSRGGWTLVFVPMMTNFDTTTLDYTTYTQTLLNNATEALIANRRADFTVAGTSASFPLPAEWQTAAPFKAIATDRPLAVTITSPNMTGQTTMEILRFGASNWSTDCAGGWETTTPYGRICVPGTKAPFFNAFASSDGDYCVESTELYYAMACSATRMFTIAVR